MDRGRVTAVPQPGVEPAIPPVQSMSLRLYHSTVGTMINVYTDLCANISFGASCDSDLKMATPTQARKTPSPRASGAFARSQPWSPGGMPGAPSRSTHAHSDACIRAAAPSQPVRGSSSPARGRRFKFPLAAPRALPQRHGQGSAASACRLPLLLPATGCCPTCATSWPQSLPQPGQGLDPGPCTRAQIAAGGRRRPPHCGAGHLHVP